jgi:DNA-binding response OmpR family regulator
VQRRRILVVDDDQDGAVSLGRLLELKGYAVSVAFDGQNALAAAARIRPDAVLLDIGMPFMNGIAVCRSLRLEPWARELLIIAITGWTRQADRAAARKAGCDHYLLKPVRLETIETLLGAVGRRSRRSSRRRRSFSRVNGGRGRR